MEKFFRRKAKDRTKTKQKEDDSVVNVELEVRDKDKPVFATIEVNGRDPDQVPAVLDLNLESGHGKYEEEVTESGNSNHSWQNSFQKKWFRIGLLTLVTLFSIYILVIPLLLLVASLRLNDGLQSAISSLDKWRESQVKWQNDSRTDFHSKMTSISENLGAIAQDLNEIAQDLSTTTPLPWLPLDCAAIQKNFLNESDLPKVTSTPAPKLDLNSQASQNINTNSSVSPGASLAVSSFPQLAFNVIYPFFRESAGPSTPLWKKSIDVLCDFQTKGGGWTLIQQRTSWFTNEFNRNWTDYEEGFGSPYLGNGNYWIGLKAIRALSSTPVPQTLRIEMTLLLDKKRWAEYSDFSISSPRDYYALQIGAYSGDSGDGLSYHKGMKFSTKDRDHDNSTDQNCAQNLHGGWWFNDCATSNLNSNRNKLNWSTLKGSFEIIEKVHMKIRPTNFTP